MSRLPPDFVPSPLPSRPQQQKPARPGLRAVLALSSRPAPELSAAPQTPPPAARHVTARPTPCPRLT